MPSWPIHIALANRINKKFNFGNEFVLGCVLPDVLDGYLFKPSCVVDKNLSHFKVGRRICLDLFLNSYKDFLDNPIVLGYFVHLATDYFYNEHMAKNHFFSSDDGIYVILNDGRFVKKTNDTLFMKQNDYFNYGKKLAEMGLLGNVLNDLNLSFLDILVDFKYSDKDLTLAISKINEFVCGDFIFDKNGYKIHSDEELDVVYEECYLYILNFLENLI